MSSFKQLNPPDELDGRNPFEDVRLDSFIRTSLAFSVSRAEPRAVVWEQIEHQLDSLQPVSAKRFSLMFFLKELVRFTVWLDEILFAPPDWQERLTEHKMLLVTQIVACPGANHISLAVV